MAAATAAAGRAPAGKSSETWLGSGREWDDISPDDWAACGASGEAGTGIEAGRVAGIGIEAGKVAGGEAGTG